MQAPATRTVTLYNVTYEVNLRRCREAMLQRLIELRKAGKQGSGRAMIAAAADVDPATVSRFFGGNKEIAPETFVAIVTKGLGLEVDQIARLLSDEPEEVEKAV